MKIYRISVNVGSGDRPQYGMWVTERAALRKLGDLELSYLTAENKAEIIHELGDESVKDFDSFYGMAPEQEDSILDRYMENNTIRNDVVASLAKKGVYITLQVDVVEGRALRDALVDDLDSLDIESLTEVIALKLMEPDA